MSGLGLKSVSVSTNVDGRELVDPAFEPVREAAAGLGAVSCPFKPAESLHGSTPVRPGHSLVDQESQCLV
jgi:hypothetical protein